MLSNSFMSWEVNLIYDFKLSLAANGINEGLEGTPFLFLISSSKFCMTDQKSS